MKNDKIYLCYQHENHINFNCKLFKSFLDADIYYDTKIKKNNKIPCNSTMLKIFKYSPIVFDKYILKYKIKNIFCNININ
jgi:hypothetical protein